MSALLPAPADGGGARPTLAAAVSVLRGLERALAADGAAGAPPVAPLVAALRRAWTAPPLAPLAPRALLPQQRRAPPAKPAYRPPHTRTTTADSASESDASDGEGGGGAAAVAARARAAALRCVAALARADARGLAPHWSALLPSARPETVGGRLVAARRDASTLAAPALADPSPTVREAAHAAMRSLFEGADARSFWAAAELPARAASLAARAPAFTPLSVALGRASVGAVAAAVAGAGDRDAGAAAAALRAAAAAVAALPHARLAGAGLAGEVLKASMGALETVDAASADGGAVAAAAVAAANDAAAAAVCAPPAALAAACLASAAEDAGLDLPPVRGVRWEAALGVGVDAAAAARALFEAACPRASD